MDAFLPHVSDMFIAFQWIYAWIILREVHTLYCGSTKSNIIENGNFRASA